MLIGIYCTKNWATKAKRNDSPKVFLSVYFNQSIRNDDKLGQTTILHILNFLAISLKLFIYCFSFSMFVQQNGTYVSIHTVKSIRLCLSTTPFSLSINLGIPYTYLYVDRYMYTYNVVCNILLDSVELYSFRHLLLY